MLVVISKYLFLLAILCTAAVAISAQTDSGILSPSGRKADDQPRSFKEMLTKQRVEREKKDHEEMLKRGEEAVLLSQQLDNAFQQNKGISQKDRQKLETLERVVAKIRKELGAGDDDNNNDQEIAAAKDPRPSTLQEAFDSLKDTTMKLVDELKKTSRFTISAIAIQSSNTVLKLVRFLRLRK